MKKLLLIFLLIAAIFTFAACGGEDEPETPENPGTSDAPETPADPVKYEITWIDENGTQLGKTTVEEGKTPSYTYSVTDTAEWDYTFNGWSAAQGGNALESIPNATANASYYASVSKVKQKYTVSFNTNGAPAQESQTVEYGATATEPAAPEYDGFRFIGWYSDAAFTTAADFSAPVTGNVTYYASWVEQIDIKAYLSALLSGYKLNPYDYIPETMRHDYSENLVNASDIVTDYSSFVNTSSIVSGGFGEQWNMIIENVHQSQTFFNVLTVVEAISSASVTTFNNYIDENPGDTAHHEFTQGVYNVTISFDGDILYYVVEFTTNVPVIGEVTAQIALAMIVETGEKSVRVQLGDANALAYTVTENTYDFAIKYLGIRTASFSVARDEDGNVTGHINEHLTVSGVGTHSSADFYITEDYVSAVGNKASGLVGFTGYISELYDAESGKLIGYEVRETLSKLNFDTLWFDISAFSGFTSIKYVAASGNNEASIYVNGSSDKWEAKNVSIINFSRRFDIEFRTQYFYSYNASTQEYTKVEVQVPMIFIQEEHYETFAADVLATNGINLVHLTDEADFEKLLSDYDTLVDVFIENKDLITEEVIIAFIGEKIAFTEED